MRQQPARPPKKKKMRVMDLVIRAPKGEGGAPASTSCVFTCQTGLTTVA